MEISAGRSYYLRLVRGGEQVEILDRNTPLARLIHVSQAETEKATPWIKEVERLGIVAPPRKTGKKGFPSELLSGEKIAIKNRKKGDTVLDALLEEREDGR